MGASSDCRNTAWRSARTVRSCALRLSAGGHRGHGTGCRRSLPGCSLTGVDALGDGFGGADEAGAHFDAVARGRRSGRGDDRACPRNRGRFSSPDRRPSPARRSTGNREGRGLLQPSLTTRGSARPAIGRPHRFGQYRFKTGVVFQMIDERVPRVGDRHLPGPAALLGLEPPFQKMQQQHLQSAYQLALLAAAHALDFLGDVGQSSSAARPRATTRPARWPRRRNLGHRGRSCRALWSSIGIPSETASLIAGRRSAKNNRCSTMGRRRCASR